MNKFAFNIKKHIVTLSKDNKEYQKQVNLVRWGSGQARLDIRVWHVLKDEEEKPLKGGSLSVPEVIQLRDALNQLDLNTMGQEG